MIVRQFEKPLDTRPFRRFVLEGATLKLTVGARSEAFTATVRCGSPAKATRELERWTAWAIADGFGEVAVPSARARAGVVASLVSPTGPGRLRLDGPDDVYFDEAAGEGASWRVGQRIFAEGLRNDPSLKKVEFMFGYTQRVRRVMAAPRPQPDRSARRRPLDPRTTAALLRAFGKDIRGYQERSVPFGKPAPGQLIFGYLPGIYRYLGHTRLPGVPTPLVALEDVFTAKLAPRPASYTLTCGPKFCQRLPADAEAELLAHLAPGA